MKTSKHSKTRSANALLVTVMTLVIVGVLVHLALQYTGSVGRNVQRSLLLRQATAIGDASTETAFAAWRAICQTNENNPLPRSSFTAIPSPAPSAFPGQKYTLTNYSVYPLDSNWKPKTASGSDLPAPIGGTFHGNATNPGDLFYYYLASADVVIPTLSSKNAIDPNDSGNVVARVRRVFSKEIYSLWRYAIFFNDDLEIHPGAPMNVNGEVHTNGDLFTAHDYLTLSGKTSYVDDWQIDFKPGDSRRGKEKPTSPTWPADLPPASTTAQQPYDVTLLDYHKLIEQITDTKDPLYSYSFANQAGLVVTIDASNTVKVYNKSGTNITSTAEGIALKSAITTNQTITDNREGATTGNGTIRLTTLDVSVLRTKVNSNTFGTDWNGILYVVDTSADPNGVTAKRGIRLNNGGKLPDGGLTVVSGNPVYIQGDYNTGTTLLNQPPSNSVLNPDPTQPTVPGYTRQPSAVMADAVNILSNSWKDILSGTNQLAANTTVNTAVVSGNVPTANGTYSGGVENFPRFLENWSGKNFTYYGSMIELYPSEQAIGKWGAANVYSAPNRAWYFDRNFISTPPPGLLVTYTYNRSRWYTE